MPLMQLRWLSNKMLYSWNRLALMLQWRNRVKGELDADEDHDACRTTAAFELGKSELSMLSRE